MKLRDTDAEISVRELVGDVEAERTELATLEDDAVEQTQREQEPLQTDYNITNVRFTGLHRSVVSPKIHKHLDYGKYLCSLYKYLS